MPPKLFNVTVLVLAIGIGLLLIEPWGGSDRTEASPEDVAYPTQAERDDAAAELGYYPPAPSTAVGMTPEWREFADEVDRICAGTYNHSRGLEAQVERTAGTRNWSDRQEEAATMAVWADQGVQIVHLTSKLGEPPERADLFAKWRSNVSQRAALKARASEAARDGRWAVYQRLCDRIARLKERSDVIGQSFGLRICTSN
jgi:hypothetical protein